MPPYTAISLTSCIPQLTSPLTIVVPVHNRIAMARPVFAALAREVLADPNAFVLVVDQGSTDGVAQVARDYGFMVHESNARTAGALRNEGVAATSADWLCFVDSDVLVPDGYLARVRRRLQEYPDALVGCLYTLPDAPVWTERVWDMLTVSLDDGPLEWLNGGNIALHRRSFERVGGFNSSLTSAEDTDFCARLKRAGIPILQFRDLGAAHLGNPKNLRQFFNKQIWHGQHAPLVNQNSLGALAHVGLVAGVFFTGARHWTELPLILPSALLLNAVPLTAYIRMSLRRGTRAPLLASLALLHTYLLARFTALIYKSSKQR